MQTTIILNEQDIKNTILNSFRGLHKAKVELCIDQYNNITAKLTTDEDVTVR